MSSEDCVISPGCASASASPRKTSRFPPASRTVGELMAWLASRGEEYAHAFENPKVIRAAIDRTHVQPDTAIEGAARNRLLPADDGRIALACRRATLAA